MSHVVFADPVEHRSPASSAPTPSSSSATPRSRRPGATPISLGALELRQGVPDAVPRAPISPDVVRAMSLDLFFDYLGVRLNGEKAEGKRHGRQLGVPRPGPAPRR